MASLAGQVWGDAVRRALADGRRGLGFIAFLVMFPSGGATQLAPPHAAQNSASETPTWAHLQALLTERQTKAQELGVGFVESIGKLNEAPHSYVSGQVRWHGSFEQWIRKERRAAHLSSIPSNLTEVVGILPLDDKVLLELSDGNRTCRMGPHPRINRLWEGSIDSELDSVVRRGALNGSLMFHEQWLGDLLRKYTDVATAPAEGGSTVYKLRSETLDEEFVLELDSEGLLRRIEWNAGGVLMAESRLDHYVSIDGVALPAAGRTLHHKPPQVVRFALTYSPSKPLDPSEASLWRIPKYIADQGGALVLVEDSTGNRVYLGEETLLDSYRGLSSQGAHAPLGSETEPAAETSEPPPPASSRWRRWALGLAVVAGFCALGAWAREGKWRS